MYLNRLPRDFQAAGYLARSRQSRIARNTARLLGRLLAEQDADGRIPAPARLAQARQPFGLPRVEIPVGAQLPFLAPHRNGDAPTGWQPGRPRSGPAGADRRLTRSCVRPSTISRRARLKEL